VIDDGERRAVERVLGEAWGGRAVVPGYPAFAGDPVE
jgi:hypothetical protein